MHYTILEAKDSGDLVKKVNEHMNMGWLPVGPASAFAWGEYNWQQLWYQTLVRDPQPPPFEPSAPGGSDPPPHTS